MSTAVATGREETNEDSEEDASFELELDGSLYQIGAPTTRTTSTTASTSIDSAQAQGIRWVRQFIGPGSSNDTSKQSLGPIVGSVRTAVPSSNQDKHDNHKKTNGNNKLERILEHLELDSVGYAGDYAVELLGAQPCKNTVELHRVVSKDDTSMGQMLEDLRDTGVAVCPGLVDPRRVETWRRAIQQTQEQTEWQENGQSRDIRSDRVRFISRAEECDTNITDAFDVLERLVLRCTGHGMPVSRDDSNDKNRLPLWRPDQGMVAQYLKSREAHYTWHTDNEKDEDGCWRNFRTLTAILYLNPVDWQVDRDGGALEYYPQHHDDSSDDLPHKVSPTGGTVVLFDSRWIRHRVCPAHRDRLAVTQWFVSPDLGKDDDSVPKGPLFKQELGIGSSQRTGTRKDSNNGNQASLKRPRGEHDDFCRVFKDDKKTTSTESPAQDGTFSFGFF